MKKDSLRKTVFSNEDVFCLFLNVVEAVHALVFSDWAQFVFDPDQLVVLRDTVSTAHRTGLDLPAFSPTAISAIVVSSVSPERWETTQV